MSTSTNKVALVTGASDGIGAEFVKILAGRGYDLILVARRKEKLDQLAVKLSDEFGVNCTVMAADLSEPKAAQNLFQRVEDSGLQVNFLINNAGLLHNQVPALSCRQGCHLNAPHRPDSYLLLNIPNRQ